jgi:hypothetical protein
MSIRKNGNDIGKAGWSVFSMKLGGSGASSIPFNNNYVSNPGGWISMKRYYSIKPYQQPSSNVYIEFDYNTADLNAITSASVALNPVPANITHSDLYAWRIIDPANIFDVNPANGHAGVPKAPGYNGTGFAQYVNGNRPDTSSWKYQQKGNNVHSAQFKASNLGAGSLGLGSSNGKGAFQTITYTFTGNGNWSNSANWQNGTRPPAVLPNNALIIIDPDISGECVLDVSQTIPAGASLHVNNGKKFRVKASLLIK